MGLSCNVVKHGNTSIKTVFFPLFGRNSNANFDQEFLLISWMIKGAQGALYYPRAMAIRSINKKIPKANTQMLFPLHCN